MIREVVSGVSLGVILGTIGFLRIAVMESVYPLIWAVLAADRADRGPGSGRDRAMGNAGGLDAPVPPQAPRSRSGHVLCPVCGDASGRDGVSDLFLRGSCDLAWDAVVTPHSPPFSYGWAGQICMPKMRETLGQRINRFVSHS